MKQSCLKQRQIKNFKFRYWFLGRISMCALCHGTGIIRKEIYSGVVLTEGCNCEVAIQQKKKNDKRWKRT